MFLVLPLAISVAPLHGQTAPYVLPYTMSTYAGPHAAYTVGQACADGIGVALDTAGDNCHALSVSVGIDPHDLRVDGKGNVFWEDNTSSAGVVHKIDPYNFLQTIYFGNLVSAKACTTGDKYGNGCTSTDGAANTGPGLFTPVEKANRGISIALDGDLLLAGYNLSLSQKIAASNDLTSLVTGTATAGYIDSVYTKGAVSAPRGLSEDAFGNVYIADTGNNVIRVVYNGAGTLPPVYINTAPGVPVTPVAGNVYTVTAQNGTAVKTITNGPAITTQIQGPEDVQIDTNGNIYIADFGNAVVRVIYMGKGTIPNVSAPVFGNMYTIAGLGSGVTGPYPSDGSNPTVSALSIAISDRKISLDNHNNLYIADASQNVVWFVDNATGNIRVLAGVYGATAGTDPHCTGETDAVGDGCPANKAIIYTSAASNSGFGTSSDNQGNLYLSDNEGAANSAGSRIRKLLSGLNFPTLAIAATASQNIDLHFAPGDTPGTTGAFSISGSADFTAGTPNCTVRADTTDDCILPVTFSPTHAGNDVAILTVTATSGATANFELTGAGNLPLAAFDPGNTSILNTTAANAQGITLDGAGNAYVADTGHNRILKIAPGGATTTIAGTGTAGYTGDGAAATAATLKAPRAVAIDTAGVLYIADTGNNVIRKVDASGKISTYAGAATAVCAIASNTLGDNCPATQATLNAPSGLATDNFGQLYIADSGNNLVRQVSTTGYISTLAGGAATVCTTSGGATDTLGDGCSANATVFLNPTGLAFDITGQNVFVADTGDNVVRKISVNNRITVTGTQASSVLINPVTLVAGNGQAGSSIDSGSSATLSQLNAPIGVATDAAGNIYIADTGNHAVRLVSANGGIISTIVGILGTSGTGTIPGSAVTAQLSSPGGIAVDPFGTLTILDSGNNRILTDFRSQVSYNFGRVNVPGSSPVQNFTELNIGTTAFANPGVFTPSGAPAQFTLVGAANSSGTITACASTLTPGAICNIQGQFSPTAQGAVTATYTEAGTGIQASVTPSITLSGTGAILTNTTSTVAQTTPSTGNSQFGATVTLTGTVTPASCNTAAPTCFPTGTLSFVLDGTATAPVTLGANGTASQVEQGLSVGNHTISCNYSGDAFYAASSCGNVTITVAQASTTSLLSATNNGKPQFTPTTLTANVLSNTIGVPTGTVQFLANGNVIGSASLNPTTGTASLTLQRIFNTNSAGQSDGTVLSDTTLPPGTYSLTCKYSGAANYAASNCAAISFIVAPQPVDFSLVTRGCGASATYVAGTSTPNQAVACNPGPETFQAGSPLVAVAQGSTTDVTLFVDANNTLSGPVTFSCAGLPHATTCTFSPTSLNFTASTTTPAPQAVDMTLWTDLQPGPGVAALSTSHSNTTLATILGWPLTLLGLAGILRFRRKAGSMRALSLTALLFLLTGSSLVFSGCGTGGPGAYVPDLTPAGTYPITVTVKAGSVTHTTLVYWKVTAPGITGQE